jgi:hypothetical protein
VIALKTKLMVMVLVVVSANALETIMEMAMDVQGRSFVRTSLRMVQRTRLEARARASCGTSDV